MKTLLLILGAPIWLSLLIALFAVALSLYVTLWSVIISLWAVFISAAVSAPAGAVIGVLNITSGEAILGALIISTSLALAGVAIFILVGTIYVTKGCAALTKNSFIGIKKLIRI